MNTDDLTLFMAKTKTLIDSINHINNKYDEIALSQLKQSILLEVHAAINEKIISIPCLHKQISDFFHTILSNYRCGFRKGHSAQECLIVLLERWQENINGGLEFGILLTDFYKAFHGDQLLTL